MHWAGSFSIAALLALALLASCAPPTLAIPSAPSTLHLRALPDFQRAALDGAGVNTKTLRGRVVVVKFIAKYCEPCRRTLPEAEAIHASDPDVAFIAVDEDELESDARAFAAEHRVTFPVVHDRQNVLAARYRVGEAIPMTFVADATGVVRWVGVGEPMQAGLAAAIAAAKRGL